MTHAARAGLAIATSAVLLATTAPCQPLYAAPAEEAAPSAGAADAQEDPTSADQPENAAGAQGQAAEEAGTAADTAESNADAGEGSQDSAADASAANPKDSSTDDGATTAAGAYSADESKTKSADTKKKDKEAKKKAELDAKAEKIAATLGGLSVRLESASEDLLSINEQVLSEEKKLKKAKKKLKKTKKKLKTARTNVAKSAKAMYIYGDTRMMSVLLNATDFEDFASRLFLYEKITSEWQRTFAKCEEYQQEIDTEAKDVDEKVSSLNLLKAQAEAKGDAIADSLQAQVNMLAKLDKKLSKLVNKKTDKYIKRYTKAAQRANFAAVSWFTGADGATDSKDGSHPKIVKIASQFLGVDYVWGGETPSGFDCSGLTMYCYNKIGVSLPHSAREQFDCGVHVSKKALMPGDLVFFGPSIEGIHHVGIYVGDDKYLHAPHTGDVVKISKLSGRSDCVGACRPQ